MKARLRRVAAQASKKKTAARREARRNAIARLEKEAGDAKSRSFDEQPGGGTGSAADKYDRKKGLPKTKGDDPNMDYDWEAGEGYPFKGDPAGLGSGGSDADSTKQKQKALDDADAKRKELTSETPAMTDGSPSRPRPKLSSTKKKRINRRKKIAALKASLTKTAFNPEGDPKMRKVFDDMDAPGPLDKKPAAPSKGIAPKQTRIEVDTLQKSIGKALAQFLPKLQEANDDLESAVTGGKMDEIRRSLSNLMSVSKFVMRNVLVPHGGKMQKVLMSLRQASAKKSKVGVTATRLARMDDEMSRSRALIRMAASHIHL